MKNIPKITIKFAQSLDGKIASKTGDSKWISSKKSRKFAHSLRAKHDAVLVGINTVLNDDPMLNVRYVKGKNPIRVVLDSGLKLPITSKIVKSADKISTIVVGTLENGRMIEKLNNKGINVIILKNNKTKGVDLKDLCRVLNKLGIKSLLVEGGQGIITSFIKERLADTIIAVTAPIIIGGGVSFAGDLGIKNVRSSYKLKLKKIRQKTPDLITEYKIN
ncbi:MAG: RibD family protein [Elusimicrobiota bacterium]